MKELKKPRDDVGNSSSFCGEIAPQNRKELPTKSQYQFNPPLIAAIVTRKPEDIKRTVNSTQYYYDDNAESESPPSLPREIYDDLMNNPYFSGVLSTPAKLAIKLCNSETTEATQNTNPTRYDVLFVLAENWEHLIDDAEQKDHAAPDLEETLQYANEFEDKTALWTFINGLSDERKAEADKVLNRPANNAAIPSS